MNNNKVGQNSHHSCRFLGVAHFGVAGFNGADSDAVQTTSTKAKICASVTMVTLRFTRIYLGAACKDWASWELTPSRFLLFICAMSQATV
jgi:hypothetical protein